MEFSPNSRTVRTQEPTIHGDNTSADIRIGRSKTNTSQTLHILKRNVQGANNCIVQPSYSSHEHNRRLRAEVSHTLQLRQ